MSIHSRLTHQPSLIRLLCTLALATSALVLVHPPTAAAATFTVTKTVDSKDGVCNSDCSLREAIIAAHRTAEVDTITLPAGRYRVTLSDLDITSSLKIVGAAASTTIIESNGEDRVFEIRPEATVTIDRVTIRNGTVPELDGSGGGILNYGTLTLSHSTVTGNQVQTVDGMINGYGGGIRNAGILVLAQSSVSGNYATVGAGIYNIGSLTITDSTFTGNVSPGGYGGGIASNGTLSIAGSTLSGNQAPSGGGIHINDAMATITTTTISGNGSYCCGAGISTSTAARMLTITDSTISGNRADSRGGGLYLINTLSTTITNSTISGNTASDTGGGIEYSLWSYPSNGGLTLQNVTITNNRVDVNQNAVGISGGIHNRVPAAYGPIMLSNTIIAGNVGGIGSPQCAGIVQSQGYNLIGNTVSCTISGDTTGNQTGVNPQLGPLQNNGGPTFTHLPLSGSPVIDAGNSAAPGSGSACALTDQRGQPRPTDGNGDSIARCDIGAVER